MTDEIVIKNFEQNDMERLTEIQPDGWPDLSPVFRFYLSSLFCCPVKALHEGGLAGTGCLIVLGKTGWLAHIIVRAGLRSRGIGSSIVSFLTELAERLGIETVSLLSTNLGYSIYKKAGFLETGVYYKFTSEQAMKNEFKSKCIISYKENYKKDIMNLDRIVSGEIRDCFISGKTSTLKMYVSDDVLKGLYFPDFGEGYISALDMEAGTELFTLRNSGTVVFPEENEIFTEYLMKLGFTAEKHAVRMEKGKKLERKPECVFSRVSGYLG